MISVEDALNLILKQKRDFGTEKVDLLDCVGRVLAETVVADRDFPPFNRVTMDGIAINSVSFAKGIRTFAVEKVQAAGDTQQSLGDDGNCIEVMTGAVLPENTDAVVPYEQCEIVNGKATVNAEQVGRMQNVHLKGRDGKAGEVLIEKYQKITPAMIGVMASVGLNNVEVLRMPKMAICSTGDELIPVSQKPELHQVRLSNVYVLSAALQTFGIKATSQHIPDNAERMSGEIAALIENYDVVMFSGAVSKGKFDYLPAVLEKLGMEQIFHKVAQKPGKPFLFGRCKNETLIFGYPGNPVSTFVCYQKFFKPWLFKSLNIEPQKITASLYKDVKFAPCLSYHLLVNLVSTNGHLQAIPVEGSNSGDLVTLMQADGIITLPADKDVFKQGEVYEVELFD
jgi:molybdopterin molybdotransferase